MNKQEAIEILNNSSSKSVFKLEALFKLMNIADEESLNYIFKILKEDKCELIRHEAAFCLGETASEKAVDILKEVCEKDPSIVVKHECLMSLGTIGTKQDLEFVKKYLNEELFEIKCSAQIALDRINQTEFFEDVETKLDFYIKKLQDNQNTSQNERIQILFQLMKIADEKSISSIKNCLKNDICRVVRHEAAFVLGEIGTKTCCDILKEAIQTEKTPIVIHEALFALGTAGKKEYVDFIKQYTFHKNYVINESAKIALDRIKLLKKPYSGRDEFLK